VRFVSTPIAGVHVVELARHEDERGFFARAWDGGELAAAGLNGELSQCSLSRNIKAGTLRGMHFQRPPDEEAKLVRCTRGAIYDVAVDLRPESPTHGMWFGVELDAESGRALYVPEGCAHGFQTLLPASDVFYVISAPYAPASASGVRWDDPFFGITWPETAERVMSGRDLAWPDYQPGGS
jgi:dTDP-4-dehydrorhamnose 3,5-epimerase